MDIEQDIEILENMNDGHTFKDCDVCDNYNEKTKRCDIKKCRELQAIEHILSDYKRLQAENTKLRFQDVPKSVIRDKTEELIQDNLEYQRILDTLDERVYRKKYLEERRAEEENLLYPDADEVYERYFKQKEKIQDLEKEIKKLLEE